MAARLETIDAIVLRTTRFGDSDLIANVLSLHGGRMGVIAKGARSAKSRLGARLEPLYLARLGLRHGRGELAFVQAVDVLDAHDRIRVDYERQAVAAAAFDLVTKLTVEHAGNEPVFHLARRLLLVLNDARDLDLRLRVTLLTAWQLKLLHVTGLAPMLDTCARCGAVDELAYFSARDGGVICRECHEPGDQRLDAAAYAAAVWLMRTSLTDIADAAPETDAGPDADPGSDALPTLRSVRAVASVIISELCAEHAGVRVRSIG